MMPTPGGFAPNPSRMRRGDGIECQPRLRPVSIMTHTRQRNLSRARLLGAALIAGAASGPGCQATADPGPSRTDPQTMQARERVLERKRLETAPVAQPAERPESAEVPESVLADVRRHLAARTGADPDGFEVQRATRQEWPSGAMGCPQPDLIYTQRPVTGYWVVLRHAGRDYDYRISEAGTLVVCDAIALEDPPVR